MKKFGLILALTLLTLPPLIAQVSNPSIIVVSGAPSGSCGGSGLPMQYVFSTGVLYACQNGTWGQIGGGGGGGPYLPRAGGTMTGPIAFSPISAANATVGNLGAEGPVTNILGYGAVADGVLFSDCTITATQNTATCPAETFTSGDVGKLFQLYGAGTSSGLLVTTISGFTSTHVVTLTTNAGTTVTTKGLGSYGTNNATAISNALTAAIGNTNTLFIPSGIFLTNAQIVIQTPGFKIQGVSSAQSQLVYAGTGSIDGFLKIYPVGTPSTSCSPANTCAPYVTVENLTIRGNTNAGSVILKEAGIFSTFRNIGAFDALTNNILDEFDVYSYFDNVDIRSTNNITNSDPTGSSQYSPVNGLYLTSPTGAGGSGSVGPMTINNLNTGGQTKCGAKYDDAFVVVWTGGTAYAMPAGSTAALCLAAASGPGGISNTFSGIDFEGNTVLDISTAGTHDHFINLQTNTGVTVGAGATQEEFENGNYVKGFTIASGASGTMLIDCCSAGSGFSDSSTSTVYQTSAGIIIPNATGISARNAAGTGNVAIASVDASNNLKIGSVFNAALGDTQLESGNYILDLTNIETINGANLTTWNTPNNFTLESKTTTAVAIPVFTFYTDNNLYIGSTSMVGHPVFRTGDGTYSFTGTGLTTFAGPVAMGGTKFTTSGCSVSSTTGNGTAGKMTLGANTCNVVITLNGATGITAASGWTCHANDETTAAGNTGLYFSANNTTTATLAVPATAGSTDVIDFSCSPF